MLSRGYDIVRDKPNWTLTNKLKVMRFEESAAGFSDFETTRIFALCNCPPYAFASILVLQLESPVTSIVMYNADNPLFSIQHVVAYHNSRTYFFAKHLSRSILSAGGSLYE